MTFFKYDTKRLNLTINEKVTNALKRQKEKTNIIIHKQISITAWKSEAANEIDIRCSARESRKNSKMIIKRKKCNKKTTLSSPTKVTSSCSRSFNRVQRFCIKSVFSSCYLKKNLSVIITLKKEKKKKKDKTEIPSFRILQ